MQSAAVRQVTDRETLQSRRGAGLRAIARGLVAAVCFLAAIASPAGRASLTLGTNFARLTFAAEARADDTVRAYAKPEPTSLLLITIDTLRPDRLGCAGNPKVRTPNLDALATSGVLFETVVASAPTTAPSHATIMTALSPRAHGVLANGQTLSPDVTTLAEVLRAAGYETGAVVSSYVLAPRIGLDRGFDAYIRAYERPDKTHEVSSAESTYARVAPWLREHARDRFFLWIHLYDPHQPYDAPGVFGQFADPAYTGAFTRWNDRRVQSWNQTGSVPSREAQHLAARYDSEVNYVDAQLGRLLDVLDATGARDRTLICVTSDHGETLGEHAGYFGHVHQLYDSTLRVPLIFSLPGRVPPRAIVSRAARLLDVAPTCVDLLRLAAMNGTEGRSLLPFDSRVEPRPRDKAAHDAWAQLAETARAQAHAVSETGPSDRPNPESQGIPRMLSMRTPNAKLLRWLDRDSTEVFDLATDPGETRNLAGSKREFEQELSDLLSLWQQAMGEGPALEPLDEETRERLRSLGYID